LYDDSGKLLLSGYIPPIKAGEGFSGKFEYDWLGECSDYDVQIVVAVKVDIDNDVDEKDEVKNDKQEQFPCKYGGSI
jgi:hypothetical protein